MENNNISERTQRMQQCRKRNFVFCENELKGKLYDLATIVSYHSSIKKKILKTRSCPEKAVTIKMWF